MRAWSRTLNLVGTGDLAQLEERHLADSLQIVPLLNPSGAVIDLGSGAGFPGLVIAVATGRNVHLVESDRRKAAFLREAARICDARVAVHAARIERIDLPRAATVTARALAPLATLLTWAVPLLTSGGVLVLHKGRQAEAELTAAAPEWHMRVERWRSRTDPAATLLRLSEIARHESGHG